MNLQKRNTRIYLSSLWIWNFWAPFIPSRAPKPCTQKYNECVKNGLVLQN